MEICLDERSTEIRPPIDFEVTIHGGVVPRELIYVHATNDGIEEDMQRYVARWNCTVIEKADDDS